MIDFETELNKLLSREIEPLPRFGIATAVEMAVLGQDILKDLQKKQTDVSLQVEEIYDILKEQDTKVLEAAYAAEKERADKLVLAAIAICDLLEVFYTFARQSDNEALKHQAGILWEQSGYRLYENNIVRIGAEGQPLNPQIHTVQKSVESHLPCEQVLEVLQSGYLYKNAIVRKAAVVVSGGQAEPEEKDSE